MWRVLACFLDIRDAWSLSLLNDEGRRVTNADLQRLEKSIQSSEQAHEEAT